MYQIVSESHNEYQVLFDPNHAIYKAHFPGNPITPGVCLMLIVGDLASKSEGRKLRMVRAANVKFLSILNPARNANATFALDMARAADRIEVKAVIENEDGVVAKMTIFYE